MSKAGLANTLQAAVQVNKDENHSNTESEDEEEPKKVVKSSGKTVEAKGKEGGCNICDTCHQLIAICPDCKQSVINNQPKGGKSGGDQPSNKELLHEGIKASGSMFECCSNIFACAGGE